MSLTGLGQTFTHKNRLIEMVQLKSPRKRKFGAANIQLGQVLQTTNVQDPFLFVCDWILCAVAAVTSERLFKSIDNH